jgi:hypothetical protein
MVYSFVNNLLEIILNYIFDLYQNLEIFIYKYNEEYNNYYKTKNYKLLFEGFPQIVKNKKWYTKIIDEFINDDILHFIKESPQNHITREIVFKALNQNTLCYEYIPEWFKYDKGIINFVLKKNNMDLESFRPFVNNQFCKLHEELDIFIYEYDEDYNNFYKTKNYKLLFEGFPQIVKNKQWYNKIIDEFINDDILHFIKESPQNHITREIVIKALIKNVFWYKYIPEWFKYDKGIINFVLKRNYKVFKLFPPIVKINWIKEGLKININLIKFINSDSFNLDVFNLVKEILVKDINNFSKLSIDLQYDSDVIDFVVEKIINKTKKNKLCQSIIDNRPIILNTVKKYPMIIKELNNNFINNKEIIMEAVKRDGNLYRFASEILKDDMEIVLTSYMNSKNFYHYYSEKNKEIIDLHYLSV